MLDDARTPPPRETLAANARRLRIARHLSLSELARATGISKATLSSLENGHANPTVDTLASLAGAMRVSFSELLEELPRGEVRVVRAGRARRAERRPGGPCRPLDAIAGGGSLEVAELELAAGESTEIEPKSPGSRAHLYVLEGKLLTGPVELVTELDPGDYASFPADVPHVFEAGRRPARALLLSERPA